MDLLHRHLPSAIVLTLPTNPLPLIIFPSTTLSTASSLPDQRSVNSQLTLSLINNRSIVICYWVSTDSCILWKVVDSRLRCWWGVNRVSTEVLMKYPLSIDQVLIEGIDQHLTTDAFRTQDSSQAAIFVPWFYMKLTILGDICAMFTWSWFKQDIIENPVFLFNWCSCDWSKNFTVTSSQW